jgi:hypothetical protein
MKGMLIPHPIPNPGLAFYLYRDMNLNLKLTLDFGLFSYFWTQFEYCIIRQSLVIL